MCGETVIWLKPKAQGRVQSIGSWLDRFGEDGRKGDNTCRHQYEFLLARNMNWRGRSNRAHNSLLASPPRERWLRHFGWRPDPSSKNLRFFFFYFWSKHSYFDVTERASLACTDSFLQGSECVCVCVCVSVIYSKISFPFMLATGNKKLILKIGDDRESSFGSKIDVYFNLREGQVYPLGLYGGTEVELTWLCLRKTQKTGRLYCTSTLLTCIRLVKLGRQFGYISRLFHFPYNIIIYIIASGNKVLGNKTIIVTLFFFFIFFFVCAVYCGAAAGADSPRSRVSRWWKMPALVAAIFLNWRPSGPKMSSAVSWQCATSINYPLAACAPAADRPSPVEPALMLAATGSNQAAKSIWKLGTYNRCVARSLSLARRSSDVHRRRRQRRRLSLARSRYWFPPPVGSSFP